jgi:microcystin-dependent protein
MSKQEHAKDICKIFGSVKIYKSAADDWVTIHSPEIGDIKHSVRSDNHAGWLKCDGTAVSRATYSALFAVIGTSFGVGNGSTTFNLPDAQGRVLGGVGTGADLTARTTGAKVGAETHTLTTGEMPAHTHSITDPGHTHSYVNNVNNQNTDNAFSTEIAADNADLNQTTDSSTTGITINSTGGGDAHNNMQPTLFIGNVFIFASHQI